MLLVPIILSLDPKVFVGGRKSVRSAKAMCAMIPGQLVCYDSWSVSPCYPLMFLGIFDFGQNNSKDSDAYDIYYSVTYD